jgi:predicted dehydrogenase
VRLVGEKFGIARTYAEVGAMLEAEELDAVIVATSTDAHKSVTLAALEAGKDVLIEKPIARTYGEAAAIAEAARTHKRKVMVGMNHRFRPDSMILKSFLEGKELGKVMYARAGWLRRRSSDSSWFVRKEKSGGGVFIDLGIMMLDMALWMMDYPAVERVNASLYHQRTKSVEDTAVTTLTLTSGAAIVIEVSWSMYVEEDIYYCYVFGNEGTASLQPLRIIKELHGNLVNVAPAKIENPQVLFRRSYENELKHFLGAVRGTHPVISSADEAVQRMRVVDAVYRSAKQRKEIVLS